MKKLIKKFVTYICVATMLVTTMAGTGTMTAKGEETSSEPLVFKQAKEITAFEQEWDTTGDGDYKWLAYVGCDASADFGYLKITYKGDAAALDGMRLEFKDPSDETIGSTKYWFSENAEGTLLTTEGTVVPQATEEEQTAIIDLAASGVDTSKGITAFHIHSNANAGKVTIVKAEMLSTKEIEFKQAKEITAFEQEWDTTGDGDYKWLAYVGCDAGAAFKYLRITYKGDATALDGMRLEFRDPSDATIGSTKYWFSENAEGTLRTPIGEVIPQATEEEQTAIIDLTASGVDTSKGITAFHIHANANAGKVTIIKAEMLSTEDELPPEPTEPPTTKPSLDTKDSIVLDGDEYGKSAMIKKFDIKGGGTAETPVYTYCGWATFKDLANGSFKYLKITYTGNISFLRFQFEAMNGDQDNNHYWFDQTKNEGKDVHFVTEDGSAIPLEGNNTTVIIDLEKSGVNIAKYCRGIHMHCSSEGEAYSFEITNAVLYGGIKEVPTTEAPTTKAPVVKVKKPAKVKITKVYKKKKSAKTVKLSIKKIKKVKGYQVAIAKTSKFKKTLVKKFVKKTKITITSKKLKNQKKLYVRVRAYRVDGKKKVYGNWSKVRSIKTKK